VCGGSVPGLKSIFERTGACVALLSELKRYENLIAFPESEVYLYRRPTDFFNTVFEFGGGIIVRHRVGAACIECHHPYAALVLLQKSHSCGTSATSKLPQVVTNLAGIVYVPVSFEYRWTVAPASESDLHSPDIGAVNDTGYSYCHGELS
jgi:hypothetical protein